MQLCRSAARTGDRAKLLSRGVRYVFYRLKCSLSLTMLQWLGTPVSAVLYDNITIFGIRNLLRYSAFLSTSPALCTISQQLKLWLDCILIATSKRVKNYYAILLAILLLIPPTSLLHYTVPIVINPITRIKIIFINYY